jgi:nucleoside-diphosphate-sugar epimerase
VYGPEAGVYGSELLAELRSSRPILVNGGEGICNAVYIDDVVSALVLAAENEAAWGERFLVSGPDYPTWAQFFGCFERMLGVQRTVTLSEREALALWHQSQRRPWLLEEAWRAFLADGHLRRRLLGTKEGAVLHRVVDRLAPSLAQKAQITPAGPTGGNGEPPIAVARPWVIRNTARKARVRIDKARDTLGYVPDFELGRGMRLTEQWARYAGLLS